ncbi:MAG: asparagine synthase (glutamine-hydrolyzing), partial [Pseudomonadota bacterium]
PLYYVETEDGIVFASEIESLLKGLDKRPSLNRTMVPTYLRMGYVPGEQTMMQEVKRLLPGHWMKVHPSYGIKIEKYWDLMFQRSFNTNHHKKSEPELLEELRHLMLDATKLQLRSDVPLGVFLSGGVDSSAVVAMMHQLGIEKKSTFSVAWDLGPEFDETKYAREVAQQFNAEHHEYWMSAKDFVDFLPQWIRHMGEPVTEAAAVSLYYIAQKARQDVTVVLSGEGADEVFGGYPIYGYFQWLHRYANLPAAVRALLDPCISALGPKWRKYVDISRQSLRSSYSGVSFYPESEVDWLLTPQARAEFTSNKLKAHYFLNQCYDVVQKEDIQTQMQYVDVKSWLVDDLLIKADRMSMAASLELRVPFLDHRLMEWAAGLPSSYRLKNGETKYLLKKALEPWLPRSVLYRKKQGFPTPLKVLFRGELSNWVRDLLLSSKCLNRGFFDSVKIEQMLLEHQNKKRDWHRVLWLLAVFELWNQNYLDN